MNESRSWIFSLIVRQAVERLQHHDLEHHHGIVRRTATLGPVGALQRLGQRLAENFPWHYRVQLLEQIARLPQTNIPLVNVPETRLSPHLPASEQIIRAE